jgi:serpin B
VLLGTHGPTLRQLLAFLGSENTHHTTSTGPFRVSWSAHGGGSSPSPPASSWTARFSSRQSSCPPPVSAHQAVTTYVDFKNQPAAATAETNAFAEHATAGAYAASLLSGGAVDRETKIVLANGMHFKATWAQSTPSDTVRDIGAQTGGPARPGTGPLGTTVKRAVPGRPACRRCGPGTPAW